MIRKEGSLARLPAPTLLISRDARVRSAAGSGGAPAPATRGRAALTSILRLNSLELDGRVRIDVDAPARATRRAEALASMRKREAAILRVLGGGWSPPPWREIGIRHSPVDRPALAPAFGVPAAQAGRATVTSRPVTARGSTAVAARADNAPHRYPASVDLLPGGGLPAWPYPGHRGCFPESDSRLHNRASRLFDARLAHDLGRSEILPVTLSWAFAGGRVGPTGAGPSGGSHRRSAF